MNNKLKHKQTNAQHKHKHTNARHKHMNVKHKRVISTLMPVNKLQHTNNTQSSQQVHLMIQKSPESA